MNGSEIYDLVTSLLDGEEISETLFVTLVNQKKLQRELKRDWQVLKAKSTAYTVSASTTSSTTFALPANCMRPIKNTKNSHAIVFLNASGKKAGVCDEVLFERQYDFIDTPGKFFIDQTARTFSFTGNPPVPETYSAYLFYLKASLPITYVAEAGQGWDPFLNNSSGVDFSPILAYDVAMMYKGGIDFDDINARMVQYIGIDIADLEYAMAKWDDNMKISALQV